MQIESITHHGLGRTPSGTLLPQVLPGEEVEIADDGKVRVLTPSPERVRPPCRHFKSCGGCAMQHASDPFVAGWKTNIVARALAGRGLPHEIGAISTSPANSRRRAKLSGRRTKKGAIVGFHARGSDTLVQVPDCQLLTPKLMAGFQAAEALIMLLCSRSGELSITLTESQGGLDFHIEYDRELTREIRVKLANLAQVHKLARLTYRDEPIAMITPPLQLMGKAKILPPPGAFLQATYHGEAALVSTIQQMLGRAGRVVDLFSGCGTFSLPIAETAEVHAVESSGEMLNALDQGWRNTPGLKRISTEKRDLFRRPLLPEELKQFDAVVIDPPRAGAETQISEIAQAQVPIIAMVSCNPITFSRDAAHLMGMGYKMNPPRIIDQFRWSTHVELVAQFTIS